MLDAITAGIRRPRNWGRSRTPRRQPRLRPMKRQELEPLQPLRFQIGVLRLPYQPWCLRFQNQSSSATIASLPARQNPYDDKVSFQANELKVCFYCSFVLIPVVTKAVLECRVTEFKIARSRWDNTEDNRRFHRESQAAVCHHIAKRPNRLGCLSRSTSAFSRLSSPAR